MNKEIELLAPGGDLDSIKAAIVAGADAIYCGINKFNARNRAENIGLEDLNGILRLAHSHNCKVFLTLNILILESEIPDLIRLLNKLINTSIDGIIIQDLGLFYILNKYYKSFKIHASTQLTTHNEGQLKFLADLGAERVNLSRELCLAEITSLNSVAHKNNLLSEVFVHGSYCISFSGVCYMSSVHGGNSGNRGRCSQPCRAEYLPTPNNKIFPLNLKDNAAILDLRDLANAGVDSIKIEGRIKKFHYVFMVVTEYRKQLERLGQNNKLLNDKCNLFKVFNRDFSNSYLRGDIHKNMFIDNPRDHSSIHLAQQRGGNTEQDIDAAEKELYEEKGKIRERIKAITNELSIQQSPIQIGVSGKANQPLKVKIKTTDSEFILYSKRMLVTEGMEVLDRKMFLKRFKNINNTEYFIEHLDFEKLEKNLFIPFKEITALKNQVFFKLKGAKEEIAAKIPKIKRPANIEIKPKLAILISSSEDLKYFDGINADIYLQLPDSIKNKSAELLKLFDKNRKLIPWFPSILMGEDFSDAKDLLQQLQPSTMVTNNTGIAYEAHKLKIPWIAGPYLNLVNSYALLSLKEIFKCSGAFLSNELGKHQIERIKKPENFELHFQIYHPNLLLTSRQCLFHQVTGCVKESIDEDCMTSCVKSTTITNLKKQNFFIHKEKGNHHQIYNEFNYLNTEIINDIPNFFSSFLIDLREIKTNTKVETDRLGLIKLFKDHISGRAQNHKNLNQIIHPTTLEQYKTGI